MCISEIAVITGEDGRTIPLSEPGIVIVFRRSGAEWLQDRMFPFSLEGEDSLAGLRRKTAELDTFLGGCRTVVTAAAGGAVFFELEKAGCSVWVVDGAPGEFLDALWKDAATDLEEEVLASAGERLPVPVETACGRFTISISEIQGNHPEVSSKMVLLEFIRTGAFTELEIVCDHLPPWIEIEAERLGISIGTETHAPHEVIVVLRKANDGACF